jgi:hypothetical protein
MGATPIPGFPSGYVFDVNSFKQGTLTTGFSGEGGAYAYTAFFRSRYPSADFNIIFPFDELPFTWPVFDGSSSSDGIAVQTLSGDASGVGKKLHGAVAAGEPVEFSQSYTDTVVRYAGGNFFGVSAEAASVSGVVTVMRQLAGTSGVQALVASLTNTGYRLVPTAGTPGYFTASAASGPGAINAYSTATQSSGTPSLVNIELFGGLGSPVGSVPGYLYLHQFVR